MTATNVFVVSQQMSTAGGNLQLGQFVVNCPNTIGEVLQFSGTNNFTTNITPPAGTTLVCMVPLVAGNASTWSWAGIPVSNTQPSFLTVTGTTVIPLIITQGPGITSSFQVWFI